MPQRLTIEALNQLSAAEFAAALANVVERSPWIAEAVERIRPFASLAALRDAITGVLAAAEADRRVALIQAHPDLADRVQRADGLTAESVAEQDMVGLDRLSEAEFETFERLNADYRDKFGFPFILGVRRHTRDSIFDVFTHRLENAPMDEMREAIREIGCIASLRLADLFEEGQTLAVHGNLSTHVLDIHAGQPADGILVELIERSRRGESRLIAKTVTNAEGRTDGALIEGRPIPIGRYELRFHAGAYFARRGLAPHEPRFLDVIPIRFGVSEPEGRLHVPLLMTPWSYSTYRGS
jgi:2-oxo-4-hydroxy-4-carboxy-5-ureidoimidazoline decarboxylase